MGSTSVREGLRQDLECHVPVELGVSGSIHLAHSAFADLGGDGVGAKVCSVTPGATPAGRSVPLDTEIIRAHAEFRGSISNAHVPEAGEEV